MDRDDIEDAYGRRPTARMSPQGRPEFNFATRKNGQIKLKKQTKSSSTVYRAPANLARQATPEEKLAMYGKFMANTAMTHLQGNNNTQENNPNLVPR